MSVDLGIFHDPVTVNSGRVTGGKTVDQTSTVARGLLGPSVRVTGTRVHGGNSVHGPFVSFFPFESYFGLESLCP